MVDDLLTAGPAACPACRALVPGGAPFCTLCHFDLRPRDTEPPRAGARVAEPPFDELLTAARSGIRERAGAVQDRAGAVAGELSWPCGTCGTANPFEQPNCVACGAGFLAQVRAAEPPLLQLPVVGDLARLSRAQAVGLAIGVVGLVLLVVFLLGLVPV